jgi:hypothetical protein
MDRLKFFELTRRYHVIDNPISEAKLDHVVDVLNLTANAKVLDMASGKGELVCRIAAKYGAHCTGGAQSRPLRQRRLGFAGGPSELVKSATNVAGFQADAAADVTMCRCGGSSAV